MTIDAVIDKAGSVVEMKVVSGPALLIPAALAAARPWKFEPTYLNDEPIDVQFILTVHFQLQNWPTGGKSRVLIDHHLSPSAV